MPPDLRALLSEYRYDSTRICVEAVRNIRRDHAKVHGRPANTFCSLGRESFGSSGKSRERRGVFGPAMCGNRGLTAQKKGAQNALQSHGNLRVNYVEFGLNKLSKCTVRARTVSPGSLSGQSIWDTLSGGVFNGLFSANFPSGIFGRRSLATFAHGVCER